MEDLVGMGTSKNSLRFKLEVVMSRQAPQLGWEVVMGCQVRAPKSTLGLLDVVHGFHSDCIMQLITGFLDTTGLVFSRVVRVE